MMEMRFTAYAYSAAARREVESAAEAGGAVLWLSQVKKGALSGAVVTWQRGGVSYLQGLQRHLDVLQFPKQVQSAVLQTRE